MKINRHTSEKRTWKTVGGDFVSREFAAGREIEVSDALTPAELDVVDWALQLDLRRSVLMPFVLEGAITPEEFQSALALYEGMLAAAKNPSVSSPINTSASEGTDALNIENSEHGTLPPGPVTPNSALPF